MTSCLLVTANVGSIFEDPNGLLKLWIQQFLESVTNLKPTFIALHCQEFGGKNYEETMGFVDEFIKVLLSSKELVEFENIRFFLDEDFKSNDKFTALGNLYLVHKSQEAHIWDFKCQIFVPVIGKEIHSGNIEHISIKEKLKFPQEFYPECKWSRKGFMKTRWLMNGTQFNLINIHLFHDESNFESISEYPSPYAKNRRKALEYTFEKIGNDISMDLPLFIFGDFNFRLDTKEVVRKLTNDTKPSQTLSQNGDIAKLSYSNSQNDRQLLIERKLFLYSEQNFFNDRHNIAWLLEHDKEPSYFEPFLSELKIDFPPSYPFKEEITFSSYMNTRCPSWCDRILMNKSGRKLLDEASSKPKYDLMGLDVPMGDHKPVYLLFKLQPTKELTEQCKHVLNSLLSRRFSAESDSNLKGEPPSANNIDCKRFPSSHLKSISPIANFDYPNAVTENDHIYITDCGLPGATNDCHHSKADFSPVLTNINICQELNQASKPKILPIPDYPKNNSFTKSDNNKRTSRIQTLKRYCVCCIV